MESDVLTQVRHQLSHQLGDNEAEYQALMREWFSGRITRAQIDENVKHLFSSDNVALHNRFILQIFSYCQGLSKNFENNLCFNERQEIVSSDSHLSPGTNSFEGVRESSSPAVDVATVNIKTNVSDDDHANIFVDPNFLLDPSDGFQKPAKVTKLESPSHERIPPRKPSFLVQNTSWKDSIDGRLPEIPVLENDNLKPKYSSETGNLFTLESVIGRVYLGLWQNGLATASEESMHLICKATVDVIKQIIANLLNLNFDEARSSHLLNVNSSTDISFRSQLQPSKELRNCERQLSAEMSSKYINVPLGVRDLKMLLCMRPELLPINEIRTIAIERCFFDT